MTSPLDSEVVEQIRRLGGESLLRELVEVYLEHTPKRLEALGAGMRQGDLVEVEKAAHSIRSSSISLGARVLAEEAAAVERMAQGSAESDFQERVTEFEAKVAGVLGFLRSQFSGSHG